MTTLMLVVLLAQAGAAVNAPPPKAAAVVHIKNFVFKPATVKVKAGEAISFINDDSEAHTVTSTKRLFDSGGMDTKDVWTHVFAQSGTFTYLCTLHPQMKGSIVVTSPSSGEKHY